MGFKCEKCHKKFKVKRNLIQHLKKQIPCNLTYECTKCYKVFKTPRELTRHENRITSCAPTEVPVITDTNAENKCQYCNKEYANKQNLVRHLKTCDKEANMRIIMEKLMAPVMEKLDRLEKGSNNVTIINNMEQNLYVGNNLCHYGEEDPMLLDHDKVQTMLLEDAKNFVPRLIREIHNNLDLPQNHNVFYDQKTDKAMVFTRKLVNGIMVSTWVLRDFKTVSQELVNKAKRYPTCMPLAQNIKPNSIKERQYVQSMLFVTKEYEHTEKDMEMNKKTLTDVTKNLGFFQMIEDTTYVSNLLPLIPLN